MVKLTQVDGVNVVKLSDQAGKETGDPETVKKAREYVAGVLTRRPLNVYNEGV